jgi:hypothetical protein
MRRPLNLNSHNHNQRDRRPRFSLAVQISRESSMILATAYHSLRYPNPFRCSLQYETQHWLSACNSSVRQLLAGARSTAAELLRAEVSQRHQFELRTNIVVHPPGNGPLQHGARTEVEGPASDEDQRAG